MRVGGGCPSISAAFAHSIDHVPGYKDPWKKKTFTTEK